MQLHCMCVITAYLAPSDELIIGIANFAEPRSPDRFHLHIPRIEATESASGIFLTGVMVQL